LAVGVEPPAPDAAVVQHHAGVGRTSIHVHHMEEIVTKVHCGEIIPHVLEASAVARVAEAELAVRVGPPTLDLCVPPLASVAVVVAFVEERACVGAAAGEVLSAAALPETEHLPGAVAVSSLSLQHLSACCQAAPTLHFSVLQQHAAVRVPTAHAHCRAAQIHGRQRFSHLLPAGPTVEEIT
jgi:hypothetical protein